MFRKSGESGDIAGDAGSNESWMVEQTECLHDPRRGSWRYFPSQGDGGAASCVRQHTPLACGLATLGTSFRPTLRHTFCLSATELSAFCTFCRQMLTRSGGWSDSAMVKCHCVTQLKHTALSCCGSGTQCWTPMAGSSRNDKFCIENEKLCIKNEKLVSKTRNLYFKMMNFAGFGRMSARGEQSEKR